MKTRQKRLIFSTILIVIVPILFLSFPFEFYHISEESLVIENAELSSEFNKDYLTIDDKAWHKVTLPDSWNSHKEIHFDGWYKSQFNLIYQPQGIWSIFIPHVTQNVKIFINNQWVGHYFCKNDILFQ